MKLDIQVVGFLLSTVGGASLKRRNADYCSVFRSEIIAIDMALDFVLEHQLFGEIWILSDSRSVVHYLVNWRDVNDRRGMDIFNKLRTLCNSCVLHIQWIPSHVNLKYNDIAVSLVIEGASSMAQTYVESLTYTFSCTQEERPLLTFLGGIHQLIHGIVVKARVLLYILREIGKTKLLWLAYHPVT
ncbi:hypothetical protein AVEN_191002-1 [Araneus ventricosus]|uniref:Uncharacterized protein n=1 Tax=Araneus ventricosus TaxID=182803 RepID=A0A4Y2T4X7_ARAVE|nr:hypothetical protein AVEN_232151-1 [Araneus ventricosus]GBN94207.1 hypothetical protein AVEN_20017-1 [Araneus ventricosus]GBN94352.1 hypothetical protein AVEN_7999-1 [Araneus ventricosus]GBN94453.1 hypothetical protein AVEN_191002-1 [Araneus ventricosus]